jgi:hypothetical protein
MTTRWMSKAAWSAPALIAVVLLLVPGVVSAAPTGSGAPVVPGPAQWAYAVQKNVSFSVSNNGTTYAVTGSIAYAVVFTQTNTSNTTFQLEVQRTLGFDLTANFATTGISATLSAKGLENISGFANFTTNGTVYVGGVATSAIAVVDQSHTSSASLQQSSSVTLGRRTASATLNAELSSVGSTTFTPALGIVPNNVAVGQSWNASTTIAHKGLITGSDNWTRTRFGSATFSGNGSLSANPTITAPETISGSDLGYVTLANGLSGQAINLTTTGPIQPRDGVLWTPSGADLFHNNRLANCAFGLLGIGTEALDWVPHARGHLGFDGSSTGFTPSPDANSVAGQPLASGSVSATTGSPAASPSAAPAQQVQAEPVGVPQAQALANCLAAGQGSCSTGSSVHNLPIAEIAVAGVAVGLVAILGAVALARRQKAK